MHESIRLSFVRSSEYDFVTNNINGIWALGEDSDQSLRADKLTAHDRAAHCLDTTNTCYKRV